MTSASDLICQSIVQSAATALSAKRPPDRSYWREADLEAALDKAANEHPDVARVSRNFTVPIPGWWPGAGRVDLVLQAPPEDAFQFDLYELKWCNEDKMEEALWDAVKLICAHDIETPKIANTYLVFAATRAIWEKSPVGAELFDSSTKDLEAVLRDRSRRWERVLAGGVGKPRDCPVEIDVSTLQPVGVTDQTTDLEIRIARIAPRGSQRFDPWALVHPT